MERRESNAKTYRGARLIQFLVSIFGTISRHFILVEPL